MVVDYGSTPEHSCMVERYCREFDANYVMIETDKWFSCSRALNFGIRLSKTNHKYIICTDIDIIFNKNVISRVKEELDSGDNTFVVSDCYGLPQCTVKYDSDSDFDDLFSKSTKRQPQSIGALLATSRDWWFKVRGFDETMELWGAEDTDLYERAKKDGLKIIRITDAPILHQYHEPWQENIVKMGWPRELCGAKYEHNFSKVGSSIVKNDDGWGMDRITSSPKLSFILTRGDIECPQRTAPH